MTATATKCVGLAEGRGVMSQSRVILLQAGGQRAEKSLGINMSPRIWA